MARGGRRTGNPAKAGQYANRSDMRTTQPVRTTSGGVYGSVKAQEEAQAAVPLQNAAGAGAAMAQGPQAMFPGDLGGFDRGTDRPDEPLTQGVPIGAGAGPEALGMTGQMDNTTAARLRNMYAKFPNEGLRILIEQLDEDGV